MHPVLFQWKLFGFSLALYSYGTMLMLAILTGWLLAIPAIKRHGFALEKALTVVFAGLVGALVLARLVYVFTNWGLFSQDFPFSVVDFANRQGLVAYGGYLGGFLASYFVTRQYNWDWFAFADAAAPSLASGLCLTRVGCFLAGCDYGKPTSSGFAISFPKNSFAYLDHLSQGVIAAGSPRSLPVHPTQLYESAAGFMICITLLYVHKKNQRYSGVTFSLFLILYGIFRFNVEFVRGDSGRGIFYGLSTSQWLALMTIGWALWILKGKRGLWYGITGNLPWRINHQPGSPQEKSGSKPDPSGRKQGS